jgi:Ca2+-binding EF-hand superfamily protein
MLRKLTLAAVLGFFCSATMALADDEKKSDPAKPKLAERGKLFEKMDSDGNGSVTKDEFKKFREGVAEKLKDRAGGKAGALDGILDKAFDKWDANGDGKLTKEEFEKALPGEALEKLGGKVDLEKLKELIKKRKNGE